MGSEGVKIYYFGARVCSREFVPDQQGLLLYEERVGRAGEPNLVQRDLFTVCLLRESHGRNQTLKLNLVQI